MKKRLILAVMLTSILALGYSQNASWNVTNTVTWIEAVNGIRSGGNNKEYSITVTGNISVPPTSEGNTFGSVTGITITLEGNGILSLPSNGCLLVINTGQTVIARDVTLRGRSNNGVYSVVAIRSGGTFYMEGKASVTGNIINDDGGGVWVDKGGTFIMAGDSSVSGNTINGEGKDGAGVFVNGGTILMQDNAKITGNTNNSGIYFYGGGRSRGNGGGVCISSGTFTMRDNALVSDNNCRCDGGGIYNDNGGTLIMQDNASVKGNKNGGVYNKGDFTMKGGTISDNIGYSGSGVNNSGTFIMQNGTISGNNASESGGGVFNIRTFTMQNGRITGNTASSGGGVTTDTAGNGYGGEFTMQGGTISGNIASLYGGGVFVDAGGYFIMQGNASVSGNKTFGNGGGVYAIGYKYENRPFTMKDAATVSGNTAGGNGGGVYISRDRNGDAIINDFSSGGLFIMQDNASIFGNTASANGGGIYFNGKSFTKTGGIIYGDEAEQNFKNTAVGGRGNAVYDTNNGGWRNATAGLTMNSDSYGFWLNEGEAIAVKFPSRFAGVWKRKNFNNFLTFTENTVKSSSSNYVWVLTRISGDSYMMKRSDTASNTITLMITYRAKVYSQSGPDYPASLYVSGDSGSGQDNWNGTWERQ